MKSLVILAFLVTLTCAGLSPPVTNSMLQWQEYAGNPVYNPYPDTNLTADYQPYVLYDANNFTTMGHPYLMWHTSATTSDYDWDFNFNYVTDWQVYTNETDPSTNETVIIDTTYVAFVWVPMSTTAIGSAIAMSYSDDGISWTLIGDTDISIGSRSVVLYDAEGFGGGNYIFKMWYYIDGGSCDIGTWQLYPTCSTIASLQYAESNDGITWVNQQPLTQNEESRQLVDGIVNNFFMLTMGVSHVFWNPNATSTPGLPFTWPYAMYYATNDGYGYSNVANIGVAFSSDGLYWTRHGDLPYFFGIQTSDDEWSFTHRYGGRVVMDTYGLYHMYYSGANINLNTINTGYATLEDPLTYQYSTKPLASPFGQGIGHAVSRDGLTWSQDSNNPIFYYRNSATWRKKATYEPTVVCETFGGDTNVCKMWFSGSNGKVPGQQTTAIGLAIMSP